MDVLTLIENLEKLPTTEKFKTVLCPKCGSEMIKRKNKFGDGYWYGCSGYPKCKENFKQL